MHASVVRMSVDSMRSSFKMLSALWLVLLLIFPGGADNIQDAIVTQLGGSTTFNIPTATSSQCKTHDAHRVVDCSNGSLIIDDPIFKDRISGTCDHIKFGPVKKEDLDYQFICNDLSRGKQKSQEHKYMIKVSGPATSTNPPVTTSTNPPVTTSTNPPVMSISPYPPKTVADAKVEAAQAILAILVALTVLVPLVLGMVLVGLHYNSRRLKSWLQAAVSKTDELELNTMLNCAERGENGRSAVDNSQHGVANQHGHTAAPRSESGPNLQI